MIKFFYALKNVELHWNVNKPMSENPPMGRTSTHSSSYDFSETIENSKAYAFNLSGIRGLSGKLIYATDNSSIVGKRLLSTVGKANS